MRRFGWLLIFSVAMAYLEATVVVYLRQLYYPAGFQFPLVVIPASQALIEVGRELATVVMLACVARLGVRGFWPWFSAFMFVFGAWDIFYYVWLKVLLGWPAGLLTWDVLFLIPVPWVGPVLAPIIVSLSLMWAALLLEAGRARGWVLRASALEWAAVAAAGAIVILSFTLDWRGALDETTPTHFRWGLFALGQGLATAVFVRGLVAARVRAG